MGKKRKGNERQEKRTQCKTKDDIVFDLITFPHKQAVSQFYVNGKEDFKISKP